MSGLRNTWGLGAVLTALMGCASAPPATTPAAGQPVAVAAPEGVASPNIPAPVPVTVPPETAASPSVEATAEVAAAVPQGQQPAPGAEAPPARDLFDRVRNGLALGDFR